MSRIDTRAALLRTSAVAALLALGAHAASAAGPTLVGGGSTLAEPTYANVLGTIGLTVGTTDCTASNDSAYALAGSGTGSTAFVTNNAALFSTSFTTGCAAGALVSYGAGDLPIASNYTNGSSVFLSNTGYQMIQVPAFGTPVTIPFNLPKKTKNGSVLLTDGDLCGIFSGKIQNWLNVTNPPVTTSTPIKVAYRQDSSGTTFLLTNHLASVCSSANSNITFTGMTTFAKEFSGFTCTGTPALCTVPTGTFAADISAKGSGGVQAAISNNVDGTGYLGPDYTLVSVTGQGSSLSKPVANVQALSLAGQGSTTYMSPNTTNTLAALAQATVPPTSATNPDSFGIVIPVPNQPPSVPKPVYPIVGYTYLYLSSQLSSATKVADVKNFLDALYNVDGTNAAAYTAITNGGFVAIPGVTSNKAVVTKPASKVKLAGTIVNDYLANNATVPFTVNAAGGR